MRNRGRKSVYWSHTSNALSSRSREWTSLTAFAARYGKAPPQALHDTMTTSDDANDPCTMAEGEVLRGAAEISKFTFGNSKHRRQIYHLTDHHGFPAFKVGNTLYARRSTIQAWLTDKEK